MKRFDAVLFDAGGVLVLPDPDVLGPLLAYYGGDPAVEAHRRAHYAAMAHKSLSRSHENDWDAYNHTYVASVGIPDDAADYAVAVLDRTRSAHLWRWPIPSSVEGLQKLAAEGVPIGVVSNAAGQIEHVLGLAGVCQQGPGPLVEMRVIVDSGVVGVEKPDPAIFDFALPHFAEFERDRIAYLGDSVSTDIAAARAGGLVPILIDPYGDHVGADFERVETIGDLLQM